MKQIFLWLIPLPFNMGKQINENCGNSIKEFLLNVWLYETQCISISLVEPSFKVASCKHYKLRSSKNGKNERMEAQNHVFVGKKHQTSLS